jgi:ferric-dicitrate binding protein FerR (iron transport regulator)
MVFRSAALVAALAFLVSPGLSAAAKRAPAGVVTTVSGKVALFPVAPESGASAVARKLAPGVFVFPGDRLKTGADGRLALSLTDGTQLKLNYNTEITLKDKNSKGETSPRGIAQIKIFLGDLWAKVTKKDSELEFDTPAAVAAVKGTEPLFSVQPDGSVCVHLREGALLVSNELSGTARLAPAEQICLEPHQKIVPALIQKWDASAPMWDQNFTQATRAEVTVAFKDKNGSAKSLKLEYAAAGGPAGLSPTGGASLSSTAGVSGTAR